MDILEVKKKSMIDSQLKSRGISSFEVLRAMSVVPREKFVSSEFIEAAYNDGPLSIGSGQTISQPYMVAMMTEALMLRKNDKVLEIGTGSGYQAAVLQEISSHIYSIERISSLAENAKALLVSLGYPDIKIKIGDGTLGWPEEAPFDAIVVTAAASHIPPPLLRQLKPGGVMVIPVGSRFMTQQLVLVEKDETGKLLTRQMLPVRFVPLTGKH